MWLRDDLHECVLGVEVATEEVVGKCLHPQPLDTEVSEYLVWIQQRECEVHLKAMQSTANWAMQAVVKGRRVAQSA